MHNTELNYGAAQALSKLLGLSSNDDEIRMICSALEMVFRGNPKAVQTAYDRITANLLAHLMRLLARCERGNMKNARITILNIAKIILHLSRCPNLRGLLARHPALLQSLANSNSIGHSPTPVHSSTETRIRTIANLSKFDDNKVLIYEEDRILETVLRTAHLDSSPNARHYAAVALMEFASAGANQLTMAHNDKLLACMVKMILVEQMATTRECVITAIQNLAFCKENRLQLVSYRGGIVLEALKKALATDKDPKSRRRAAGALTNLASLETSERIGNHKGLLDTLALVTTKDSSEDVQTRAALALTKIANGITVNMQCHESLLDALVVASLSNSTNSISAVLRVKAREPENRQVLARHPGILDTLSDICLSDTSTVTERDNAVRAIMHLVNEDKNRKIMCNKTILEALVASANYKDPDLAEARDSAVRAMERLATDFSNRSYMARHKNLIGAVASAVEREAGWEEEGQKSAHGFLAKPLLMSLLVAM